MNSGPTKILLVEDDEDDYILVRDLLARTNRPSYVLDWKSSYEEGLNDICLRGHDVYLLDYQLGGRTGLEFLREAAERGCTAPVIFLTGQGDYEVDLEAMRSGAVDFLIKDEISASLLERSIRYALERKRTEEVLRQSESQLKYLSSQLLTIQETERKKIAKELHDGIAQYLSAAKFGVENSIQLMGQRTEAELAKSLEAIVSMLQRAVKELGRISSDLWPSILEDFGLLITINRFFKEFEAIYFGIRIEKEIDLSEEELPEPVKINLYRIMQEAINNITKHTQADRIFFSLKKKDGRIELAIRDNGQGFDLKAGLFTEDLRKGLGLSAMRERAELSGGCFFVESAMGKGTVVRAWWPVS